MRNIAALLIFMTSFNSFAHELVEQFPEMISVATNDGETIVEYCPDNTCEVVRAVGPVDAMEIQDFAYLYLFTSSPYNYLKEFQQGTRSGRTGAVLDRYSSGCPQVSAQEAARCVLGRLGAKYEIQVEFVRYDEGERSIGSVDAF